MGNTMQRQLYYADGRPVQKGDEVTSFRGEKYTVTGWPTKGQNKVWVRTKKDMYELEYYPSVFNLTWEKPDDDPNPATEQGRANRSHAIKRVNKR